MSTPLQAERLALADHAVVQSFVSETVLMDVTMGKYFSLDEAGGAMLAALLESGEIHEAARRLSAGGWGEQEEVAAQMRELCGELAQIGLLATAAE
jgi:hypothetical protein